MIEPEMAYWLFDDMDLIEDFIEYIVNVLKNRTKKA
jgi:aspartyl/asparaginyl-tRNA synthetase